MEKGSNLRVFFVRCVSDALGFVAAVRHILDVFLALPRDQTVTGNNVRTAGKTPGLTAQPSARVQRSTFQSRVFQQFPDTTFIA